MQTEILEQLKTLAIKKSIPFCYGCYKEAPTGCCTSCGSDDLMRLLAEVGCDWGTDWIVKHIIEDELTTVDTDTAFEESVRECYSETVKVGWLELDTATVLRDQDPVSWDMARSEWASGEVDSGNLISFDNGSTYYWTSDVEALLS